MKKVFLFAALIAATVMMTSCTNNDELIGINQVEIRLSSGISAQTRASFPGTDTQIANGEDVAVYVDDAVASTQLYGNNVLTANGSGGFTGGTPMYFPQTGNNVDIYALHTNATLAPAFPTTAITHSVNANQTLEADYIASDLLYATKKNVVRTTTAVPLTFHHLLTKVQIAIVAGSGLTAENIAKVEILGTKPDAKFTPNKANASDNQTITASGTATAIEIGKDISTDFSAPAYNDAIIVPQTVSGQFIKITLTDGGKLYYTLSSATFERGEKHIYHITVNLSGLTVTSTIAPWEPVGAPTTGDAVMD